jgi:hypothetical protein
MSDPQPSWPPLIVAANQPRWMRWRDVGLTLCMWLLFVIMLETEFELFFGPLFERLGWGDWDTEANWEIFFQRLAPFLRTVGILVTALVVAGLFTMARRRRTLLGVAPPPLDVGQHAALARIDERALVEARDLPVAVVEVDADGRHIVHPRELAVQQGIPDQRPSSKALT